MERLLALLFSFLLVPSLCAQTIEWEKNFGGSDDDNGQDIERTFDGGYVTVGPSWSSDFNVGGNHGGSDFWIAKIDQQGTLQWEKNFGGSSDDVPSSVVQTADSGYAVAGWSMSSDGDVGGNNGDKDFWIIKLDPSGGLLWEKNYGGNDLDRASSLVQTNDSGYAVAGRSYSSSGDVGGNNGNADCWIIKLDQQGGLEWEQNLGGSYLDVSRSIVQTSDSGYAVACEARSSDGDVGGNNGVASGDFWLLKLDEQGNLEWEENYGGSDAEKPYSVVQTHDGGFALSGQSLSTDGDVGVNKGNWDYWIIKTDGSGNLEWTKNLGGSDRDIAISIDQRADSNFVIGGRSKSPDIDVKGNYGDWDCWVLELDQQGNLLWEQNYGGAGWDHALSIVVTSTNGVAFAGKSDSADVDVGNNYGMDDFWVVKLCTPSTSSIDTIVCDSFVSPRGDHTWTNSGIYMDTLPNSHGCDSIITIDLTVNTVDTTVNSVDPTTLEAVETSASYQWLDCDEGYSPFSGETDQQFTASANGNYAVEVTKDGCTDTSSCYNINSVGIAENDLNSKISVHPNPTDDKVTIEILERNDPLQVTVRDMNGRKVSERQVKDPRSFKVGLGKEPGIYMVRLRDEDGKDAMIRLVKE